MRVWVSAVVAVYCCVFWQTANAQNMSAVSLPSGLETLCESKATAKFFPEMRDSAIEVRRELCVRGGDDSEVLGALIAFIDQQRRDQPFLAFGGFSNLDPESSNQDPLDAAWNGVVPSSQTAPPLGPTRGDMQVDVNGEVFEVVDPARCGAEAQVRVAGTDCAAAVTEFRGLYNYAQSAFAAPGALAFARAASSLSGEWERYLNESRSQTPLELVINAAAIRRNETATSGFSKPPKRQLIFLHPSVVVEYIGEAIDGENTKEALMIELVGLNWWRRDEWYIPSGASIVSVYSDRPEVTDAGYGIGLHFRSVYTLGFADHDGDRGIFVSFDLLKLVQDKQKALREYNP